MSKMMGLINLEHEYPLFNELTYFRNASSIPFGGRYRMIDFTLSNMVNSGIEEVAIFVRNKYRSLMDHMGTGENWDLDRRNGGLFILPPDWNDPNDQSRGDLQFFHNNRDYFHRSKSEYVLISGSQFITNTDYQEAFQFHLDRQADVTLISVEVDTLREEHEPYLRLETDDLNWVRGLTNDKRNPRIFTGVYIIHKELLMELADHCIAYDRDHFFLHGIKEKLDELRVQTFAHQGYSAFVNNVDSYYQHNMNLLDEENYRNLFHQQHIVRTKVSNNPPVEYGEQTKVNQAIIANGCTIGGEVERSVLFRGVSIQQGAVVRNSIIMQRCIIEDGVHLENVILDKDVHVKAGQKLVGSIEKPYVVAKRQEI
ncbi:glucose-1-phosphate adenylyltransferase subunit GlgD [Virgibacillus xinjiangensis]|uniref:Glucose-1-phosphate adenylyltransferase subunit GlgD n=1 Tax=Virgibacillus xinjiangensis TaxID=393090 RepID=A0ABV7D066_9BACI